MDNFLMLSGAGVFFFGIFAGLALILKYSKDGDAATHEVTTVTKEKSK